MDRKPQHHGSSVMGNDIMPPLATTPADKGSGMARGSALDDADDDLLPPPPSLSSTSNAAQHNSRSETSTEGGGGDGGVGDALAAPLSSDRLRKEQQRRDRERAAAIQAAVNGAPPPSSSTSSATATAAADTPSSSLVSAMADNNSKNNSHNGSSTAHRPRRVQLRLEDSDDEMEQTFGRNPGSADKAMNDEDDDLEEAPPPPKPTRRSSSSSLSQILPMAVARRIPSMGLTRQVSAGSFRLPSAVAQRIRADSNMSSDVPPPPEALRRKTSFFSSEKGKRRLRCMLVSAVVFAVAIVITGVVLGVVVSGGDSAGGGGVNNNDARQSNGGGAGGTDAPTAAPTLFSQTVAIRRVVSTVPTTPPETKEDQNRPPPYDRQGTAQNRAYAWLTTQDKITLQDEGYLDATTGGSNYSQWARRVVQRYVLAVLYFSMGLPTGLRGELNYLSPVLDECTWVKIVDNSPRGILCDQDSNVILGIFLRESFLEGTLPDELGALSELIYLDLGENRLLGGALPTTALSKLEQLSVLSLFECGLTGTIPDNAGDVWSPQLSILRLYGNQMTGTVPTSLKKLTKLENVYLQENSFEGSLNPVFCASGPSSSRVGKIQDLHADCLDEKDGGNVLCSCCTTCCGDGNCYLSDGD